MMFCGNITPMESAPQVSNEAKASFEPETTYEILNSPEMRAEYITYTDGLISRLAESETDVAIFLDKSARPVAWLVKEFWNTMAPVNKQTGQIMKMPEIKFLNIDREQWGPFIGRSEDRTGRIDVSRIFENDINNLRNVLAPIQGYSSEDDISLLSNKKIAVIDEVRTSGDTLKMSEGILKRAFPDAADIEGFYWMPKPAERDTKSGMLISGEVPVWYSDRVVTGRLVANRDENKSANSNSSRQRAGALWLSTNFKGEHDESGRQLKREVKRLAEDFKEHKIPYIHSPIWSSELEPLADRIARFDGLTLHEYAGLKREAGESTAKFIELFYDYYQARNEELARSK
jgi:hypothetical protein